MQRMAQQNYRAANRAEFAEQARIDKQKAKHSLESLIASIFDSTPPSHIRVVDRVRAMYDGDEGRARREITKKYMKNFKRTKAMLDNHTLKANVLQYLVDIGSVEQNAALAAQNEQRQQAVAEEKESAPPVVRRGRGFSSKSQSHFGEGGQSSRGNGARVVHSGNADGAHANPPKKKKRNRRHKRKKVCFWIIAVRV